MSTILIRSVRADPGFVGLLMVSGDRLDAAFRPIGPIDVLVDVELACPEIGGDTR